LFLESYWDDFVAEPLDVTAQSNDITARIFRVRLSRLDGDGGSPR